MWKRAGSALDCLELLKGEIDVSNEGGHGYLRMGSFSEEYVLTHIPDLGEKEVWASAGL